MNVEPTAEIIEQAAKQLRQAAVDLDRMAANMRQRNDLEYASQAFMAVQSAVQNSRLDLLISRPIREYQTEQLRVERTFVTPQ